MVYSPGFVNSSNMTLSFDHRSYTTAQVSFCLRRVEVSKFDAIFLKKDP